MTGGDSIVRDRLLVLGAYVAAVAVAAALVLADPGLPPVWTAALADLAATILVFGFSRRPDNSSVYDPYWSVAPVFIAAYWWLGVGGGGLSVRSVLVLVLVVVWAVRLTMNWARRWRGLRDEDWRYVMLREKHGRRYWVVSFLGIHLMPTALVFLGCLPLYAVFSKGQAAWSVLDFAAVALTMLAIWIEARADAELHAFRAAGPSSGDILDTGLWSRCRHPNYLGEVLFWWGLLLFGLAADPGYWWTGVGALSITLLFVFISVPMMDKRMLERRRDESSLRTSVGE